jgi:hypothetical protein
MAELTLGRDFAGTAKARSAVEDCTQGESGDEKGYKPKLKFHFKALRHGKDGNINLSPRESAAIVVSFSRT